MLRCQWQRGAQCESHKARSELSWTNLRAYPISVLVWLTFKSISSATLRSPNPLKKIVFQSVKCFKDKCTSKRLVPFRDFIDGHINVNVKTAYSRSCYPLPYYHTAAIGGKTHWHKMADCTTALNIYRTEGCVSIYNHDSIQCIVVVSK